MSPLPPTHTPDARWAFAMAEPPLCFSRAGTLEGWRVGVAGAAAGNSRMMLAICVAFMGPLLAPCGEEGGCFHLRGSSSRGKTTAAKLAASVYGSPVGRRSIVNEWRMTRETAADLAASLSDFVLLMDGIEGAAPEAVGELAYMLADGQEKAPARVEGGPQAPRTRRLMALSTGEESLPDYMQRGGKVAKAGQEVRFLDIPLAPRVWRLPVLSTGEGSLSDYIQRGGKVPNGGQDMRCLDIPIEAGGAAAGGFETAANGAEAKALAQRLERAAVDHHGTAGPAFIEWLVPRVAADSGWIGEHWRAWRAAWNAAELPRGADGQVERAGRGFALAALAGEMATEAGITGWEPGQARWAAAECFRAWIAQRGGAL